MIEHLSLVYAGLLFNKAKGRDSHMEYVSKKSLPSRRNVNKSICIKLQNYYNATILFVTFLAIFKKVSLLIDQSPLILMRFLICFSQKSSFLSKKRQDYIPDAFNITDINLSCNIWNLNRPNNSFTFIRRYFSRKSIFSCLWPSALMSIPLIFLKNFFSFFLYQLSILTICFFRKKIHLLIFYLIAIHELKMQDILWFFFLLSLKFFYFAPG